MRIAFGELSAGTAAVPVRSHLESARGLMLVMPAVLGNHGALGTKVVSVFPNNPSRGAPMVQGAILLLDAETGRPRALLDGASLTAVRTAAGSALATELLAPRDADTLAVFGAGVQGRSHIELLARTRRLREVRIVSQSANERRASGRSTVGSRGHLDAGARSGSAAGPAGGPEPGRGARWRGPGRDGDQQQQPGVRRSRPGAGRARERRRVLPPRHAGDRSGCAAARPRGGGSARGGVAGSGRPRHSPGVRTDRERRRRRGARRDRERRRRRADPEIATARCSSPSATPRRISRSRPPPWPEPNEQTSGFWRLCEAARRPHRLCRPASRGRRARDCTCGRCR